MSHPLIRFVRRLANWEESLSVEELQKREFKGRNGGADLRPSVYELESVETELVRAQAEHAYRLDPQRMAIGLDVAGAASSTERTPGETPFSFTRSRHRELVMRDVDELHEFIEHVRATAPRHEVTKAQTTDYVRSRLADNDQEWLVAANDDAARTWLKRLAKAVEMDETTAEEGGGPL